MLHGGRAMAEGLADWVLRLAFAATVALGAYGAYITFLRPLAHAEPGYDRGIGVLLMAVALVVSIAVLALMNAFLLNLGAGPWYAALYGLFLLSLLTLMLATSGFRLIGDWHRSPVGVAATVSGCKAGTDSNGNFVNYCTLSWTWDGVEHQRDENSADRHPEGATTVWVDPSTGGADVHSSVQIVFAFIGAGIAGAGTAAAWIFSILALIRKRDRLRPWLRRRAWWRTPPRPAPPRPDSAS